MNNNIFIFTIGRMNPPTPGHLGIIQLLIEKAIDYKTDKVFIILSKTTNNENPLVCEDPTDSELLFKKQLFGPLISVLKQNMKESITDEGTKRLIDDIRVIPVCVPNTKGASPFTPLSLIIYQEEEPYNYFAGVKKVDMHIIIGDDRKEIYDNVVSHFTKKNKIGEISGDIIARKETKKYIDKNCEELKVSELPDINAYSASFVRKIVSCNLKDKFKQIYSPYLNEETIDKLYKSIQLGLTSNSTTKTKRPSDTSNKEPIQSAKKSKKTSSIEDSFVAENSPKIPIIKEQEEEVEPSIKKRKQKSVKIDEPSSIKTRKRKVGGRKTRKNKLFKRHT